MRGVRATRCDQLRKAAVLDTSWPGGLPHWPREGAGTECIRQAQEAGLEGALAEDSTDEALAQQLYPDMRRPRPLELAMDPRLSRHTARHRSEEAVAHPLERVAALIGVCTEKCTLRQSGARDNKNGMRRCGTMRPLHENGSTE